MPVQKARGSIRGEPHRRARSPLLVELAWAAEGGRCGERGKELLHGGRCLNSDARSSGTWQRGVSCSSRSCEAQLAPSSREGREELLPRIRVQKLHTLPGSPRGPRPHFHTCSTGKLLSGFKPLSHSEVARTPGTAEQFIRPLGQLG